MFDIKENLKKLPDKPGVYMHKDKMGQVIYVGKAISLRNRVHQYFQSPARLDPKTRAMVSHISEFEYIVTGSEMEALILECNLIKRFMPKYNILLRDDKTYPYIKVTLQDEWPRILKTRRVVSDGARYFGPYTDVGAVNQIVELLTETYRLKRCATASFPKDAKPCLNFHIRQCRGICVGRVDRGTYSQAVQRALEFLNGKDHSLMTDLRLRMEQASEALKYEEAAEWRDKLLAAEAVSEKQRVTLSQAADMDLVLRAGDYAVVFFVRRGKLSGRESYPLPTHAVDSGEDITAAFVKQYYSDMAAIPKEILLEKEIPETELLESWLTDVKGSRVQIIVPKRGEKRALVELARRDAIQMLEYLKEKQEEQEARARKLNGAFADFLEKAGKMTRELPRTGMRIEAYDISNTGGTDSVGAMVAFIDGKPINKAYRRFRIRTVEGPDDIGSLQEVIYRRMKRGLDGDPGFLPLPDLILMDGGKNQTEAAEKVLRALKSDIPVAGMVKDGHHRTRGLVAGELEWELKEKPELFHYTAAIQEEVHRFAIEYHRGLRGKKLQKSVLEEIPGIGEKRRNALLAHFGSVDAIASATAEELAEVPGMNATAAENIIAHLNKLIVEKKI